VDDQRIPMPSVALGLVAELVGHLAAGRSVTVLSNEEEISPREAAQLLGVSRPFAARLFDEGKIPSRRVGTHRRASVADVLIYRARCEGWAEPGKEEGMRLRRRGLQPLLLARIFPGYE
jgi:excisionase family DNA binding protein